MTSIVALRCSDGVVIGSDSAITLGASGGRVNTIEQHTGQKLRLIDQKIILAGTGSVGLMQRFHAAVARSYAAGDFKQIDSGIEFAKRLTDIGLRDFDQTHLRTIDLSAFAAYTAGGEPHLCEFDGGAQFQPEMKEASDIWYASGGIGQSITDPFLALLKEVFWMDGPPNLRGGIFTALWALKHVCALNSGGIGDPLHIAILDANTGLAKTLSQEELAEHGNVVQEATNHLARFKDILIGESESAPAIPSVA